MNTSEILLRLFLVGTQKISRPNKILPDIEILFSNKMYYLRLQKTK